MSEIRLALNSDIPILKKIWKVCFGDSDTFIDFYYANRFKPDQTFVLALEGNIAAMLTAIPTQLVMKNEQKLNAAMFYAIATVPAYQNRGLATKIINFANEYLYQNKNIDVSILVPASADLFNFYRNQGYGEGFYINELSVTSKEITNFRKPKFSTITPISPNEYNLRRNINLQDHIYIAYNDEEIDYQKKLANMSNSDIYGLDIDNFSGCAAIERINKEKVIIKEILVSEAYLEEALVNIAKLFQGDEYIIRTPANILSKNKSGKWGRSVRPFGMVKFLRPKDIDLTVSSYLGLAFD